MELSVGGPVGLSPVVLLFTGKENVMRSCLLLKNYMYVVPLY